MAGVALVLGLTHYLITPREYRATALIQIERRVAVPLRGIEDSWLENWWNVEYYPTQYRLLSSRGLAERVVVDLGLDRDAELAAGAAAAARAGPVTSADDEAAVGALAGRLLSGLEINPLRNTQLVEISFRSRSPALAARVVNGLVDAYIDWGIETRASVAGKASTFFGRQIEALKTEIADKESQLQAYSRRTDIVSLDPAANVTLKRLEALNQDYIRAVSARISREARRRELDSAPVERAVDLLDDPLAQQQRGELAGLERDYATRLNVYKPEWPAMVELRTRIEQARRNLDASSRQALERARESARSEYQTALRQEQSLAAELESAKAENRRLNSAAVEYNNLQIEIGAKRQLLDELLRKQSETDVNSRLQATRESNVRIVDKALVPGAAFRPSLSRSAGLGLGAGLAVGVALVFLLHYMDRTLKTREELERLIDVPVLAVVPEVGPDGSGGLLGRAGPARAYGYGAALPGGGGPGHGGRAAGEEIREVRIELVPHLRPRLAAAEAYRSLRTAVLLSTAQELRVLAVTSAVPGEGKTSTALNLAVVLAQLGRRVLLVDGDLRKPRLHEILGVPGDTGLVSFLTHAAGLDGLALATEVPGLWLVAAGPVPPNPSELLASDRMGEFVGWARSGFDLVVFDTAPTLAVTDAILIGRRADGTVLCLRAGYVERRDVRACRDRLAQAGVRVLGAVLNRARAHDGSYPNGYGGYGSYGGYGTERDSAGDAPAQTGAA